MENTHQIYSLPIICAIATVAQASIILSFNHYDTLVACFPPGTFALLQISLGEAVDVTCLECVCVAPSFIYLFEVSVCPMVLRLQYKLSTYHLSQLTTSPTFISYCLVSCSLCLSHIVFFVVFFHLFVYVCFLIYLLFPASGLWRLLLPATLTGFLPLSSLNCVLPVTPSFTYQSKLGPPIKFSHSTFFLSLPF